MSVNEPIFPDTVINAGGPGQVVPDPSVTQPGEVPEAVSEDHAESHQRLRRGRE